MSIHTTMLTIAGQEILLLLVPPDWSAPVVTTLTIEHEVQEGVTGVQERTPDGEVPRHSLRYRAGLSGTDLQVLRSVLGGLEGRKVAIPYWPDIYQTSATGQTDLDARTVAGQLNVGWVGDFEQLQITEDGAVPPLPCRGALIVGRLSKTTLRAITDGLADVDIHLVEDSPWELRALPAVADPGEWQDWPLDWLQSPEQAPRVLFSDEALGRTRESVTEGDDNVTLWSQRARLGLDGAQAGALMAFFAGRRGGVEAWDMPSALRPGVAVPTAPHDFEATNGRVRFASRELRLEWTTPDVVDVRFAVEQQLETPDQAQARPAMAMLYRILYEGAEQTLTDWEAPLTADGKTWTPARIEHGRLRQSLRPQDESCEITACLDDVPLLAPFTRLELETPATLEIYEMDLPAGTPQMLFTGTIHGARAKGRQLRAEAAAFGGALGRKVPRFLFGATCNHTLFSYGCTRRRPAQMAPEVWRTTGFFSGQWADPKLILEGITYPSGARQAHHYRGGWVETGAGTTRQVREILGSWEVGAQLHLLLARAIRTDQLEPGQTFSVYPGCSGDYSQCTGKFGNGEAFGGFPFVPAWIEQAPQGMPKTGK